MKKMRRVSIEFRHREVKIEVPGSMLHFQESQMHDSQFQDSPMQDTEPEAGSASAVCPLCGSPWITVGSPTGGDVPAVVDRIRIALQQSDLHVQVSTAGLRICQRSFEEIKEKL
jgi:hypothetical protein